MTFLLKLIVQFYRVVIGPMLPPSCRFKPSCSTYALTALDRHGWWHGGRLTVWRILRCNPWCRAGYDPVPEKKEKAAPPTQRPDAET